jgi:hypothetical protein
MKKKKIQLEQQEGTIVGQDNLDLYYRVLQKNVRTSGADQCILDGGLCTGYSTIIG